MNGDWKDSGLLPDAKRTAHHWTPITDAKSYIPRVPKFGVQGTPKKSRTRDGIRAALAAHDKISISEIAKLHNLPWDRVRAMIQTMGDEVEECGTKISDNSRVVKLFRRVK